MKLIVQQLQRQLQRGEAVSEDMIAKTAVNLHEQIDTLSDIATAFSDFARMPQARFQKIDLLAAIRNAHELFAHVERAQVQFDEPAMKVAWVKADKDQLLRVFNNLIKNALEAIPPERSGFIAISVAKTDSKYMVAVTDNGTGIPEEARSKLFVPNFTTKSKGMGLGLAIIKNIVENSGGRIWFTTVQGSGSTFYVELPAFDQDQ